MIKIREQIYHEFLCIGNQTADTQTANCRIYENLKGKMLYVGLFTTNTDIIIYT